MIFFDFFVSETSIAKNGSIFAIVITFQVQFRIKFSNKSCKWTMNVQLFAYKGGEPFGRIRYESNNPTYAGAKLVYVDSNTNITGSYSEKYNDWTFILTYSVSLKTGWNFMYETYSENTTSKTEALTVTTKDPGGLKWIFEEYEDD